MDLFKNCFYDRERILTLKLDLAGNENHRSFSFELEQKKIATDIGLGGAFYFYTCFVFRHSLVSQTAIIVFHAFVSFFVAAPRPNPSWGSISDRH